MRRDAVFQLQEIFRRLRKRRNSGKQNQQIEQKKFLHLVYDPFRKNLPLLYNKTRRFFIKFFVCKGCDILNDSIEGKI